MDRTRLPPDAVAAILAWFDASGRALEFRAARDPYTVWILETMAQQTQIARAAEHWAAFLSRFPTVAALADASPAAVLRAWQGLGYNRRALNLHRAARMLVAEHGGVLPSDVVALERLPGIGTYTARAIAAVAYGAPVSPVDVNVRRVLGRIVGGAASVAPARLQAIADASVPPDRPADWTHALMDLGATICLPARPQCDRCPAAPWCRFAVSDVQPSRVPRARKPRFATTARWLRGRLLDRLREAPHGHWVHIQAPIGDHELATIEAALSAMAREGLVERHATDRLRARLPVGQGQR